ncbi:TPA: pyridine nucleotide-disulfide oxidoreductase [Candidatus Poribacteria bacterium]|nr:pyridine nucleotide-disulfide oxidoreductase [Candidatus Poribacteria bacterium]
MEKAIAKVNDLKDGEMREIVIGELTLVLIRKDGKYYAMGGKCSHAGAPLAEGLLHDHTIRCPWHQACFNMLTGEFVEPPAIDDLPLFNVRISGDDVIVEIPEDAKQQIPPKMVKPDKKDKRKFVIIGGGGAGSSAVESLRHNGYQGQIIMITRESILPYDRTALSKGYLKSDDAKLYFDRSKEFYDEYGIEILTNREVISVDKSKKSISFADGSSMEYDKLLLAMGSIPRQLNVDGSDLGNIFTLRSSADADKIKSLAVKGSKAVVIGASFIGLETSANLADRGVSVTIVAPETVPFKMLLGDEIGNMYKLLHEEKGNKFRLGTTVKAFDGDGVVKQVILENGEKLPADFVILGVGVTPATKFLKGIDLNPDGSVSVDDHFQVDDDIYAAGDVATFKWWFTGEKIRIEHWRLARQHGILAGSNMAGKPAEYRSVPFFWSNQVSANLKYIGHTKGWDEIVFQGSPENKEFIAYYVKDDKVSAVAFVGNTMQMLACAQLMQENDMPTPDQLRKKPR